jgi:hypothetical protein
MKRKQYIVWGIGNDKHKTCQDRAALHNDVDIKNQQFLQKLGIGPGTA